jgi:endonuclease/exonuclease/phosphatase family metal-dependent hydrolase
MHLPGWILILVSRWPTRSFSARSSACAWLPAVILLLTSPTADARTLRILTYNIHHSEGRDGVFDLKRIAEIINAANPDLVALQELDQGNGRSGQDVFQLNQLAQLTGMQGYFGKTIDYQGGGYGNGALVRSTLHVTHTANRALPSPVGGEARGLLEVGISLDGSNSTAELNFFATHFTASSDEASRMAQAAFINDLVTPSNLPAVIGGDFNARPNSPVIARMRQQWSDPTALITAAAPQIDYVFYRGGHQWKVVDQGNFIVSLKTRDASDHYPYLVVLQSVPEPQALSMLGLCGGMIIIFGRSSASMTRTAVDLSPITPPRADGNLGGRVPTVQAAFGDTGAAGRRRAVDPAKAPVTNRSNDYRAGRPPCPNSHEHGRAWRPSRI